MLAIADPFILARQEYEEAFDWADSVPGDHAEWCERNELLRATRRYLLRTDPTTAEGAVSVLQFCGQIMSDYAQPEEDGQTLSEAIDRVRLNPRDKEAVNQLASRPEATLMAADFPDEAIAFASVIAFLERADCAQ